MQLKEDSSIFHLPIVPEGIEVLVDKMIMKFDPTILSDPHEVDIYRLAEFHYGLSIDFLDLKSEGDLVGMTLFNKTRLQNGIFVEPHTIVVNEKFEVNEKICNFIIAYNLAEYILDMDRLELDMGAIKCYRNTDIVCCECIESGIMAAALAATILIPKRAAAQAIRSEGIARNSLRYVSEAACLAETFNVSFNVALLRLAGLRYSGISTQNFLSDANLSRFLFE